jgi:SAM-dependent methyltransferase
VSITADDERRFYDQQYSVFLNLPDEALACNREVLLRDLGNPAHPVYERRLLYRRVLERLLAENLQGMAVLDYGCGTGDWGLLMATEGARVTFLDLSPVAIEVVQRRARASGVPVRAISRDASDLSCFEDAGFDLIYASAAIHHTLKYPNALAELVRILKPGGKLILAETYGNNPLLNAARRLRWRLSRQPEEAGEDILLTDRNLSLLGQHFHRLEIIPLNLLAMTKRFFRGYFTSAAVRGFVQILEGADTVLLRAFPSLRRYCGEVLVVAEK